MVRWWCEGWWWWRFKRTRGTGIVKSCLFTLSLTPLERHITRKNKGRHKQTSLPSRVNALETLVGVYQRTTSGTDPINQTQCGMRASCLFHTFAADEQTTTPSSVRPGWVNIELKLWKDGGDEGVVGGVVATHPHLSIGVVVVKFVQILVVNNGGI